MQPLLKKIFGHQLKGMSRINELWSENYFFWGAKFGRMDRLAIRAMQNQAPAWFVEDSYIRSIVGSLVNEQEKYSLSCSLTFDDLAPHYDGNHQSRIEKIILEQKPFMPDDILSSREMIDSILNNKLTKYNDQPIMDFISIGTKTKKVLIILQSFGDASVEISGGDVSVFSAMFNDALRENPDTDILVKLHPDTLIKDNASYISNTRNGIYYINFAINPISLLSYVDKVYVYSSQMGFEALLLGKEVIVYGTPWYSGWGLTIDKREIRRRLGHKRRIEQLFAAFYRDYTCYFDGHGNLTDINEACSNLLALRRDYLLNKYSAKRVLIIKLDGLGDYILARKHMRSLSTSDYFKGAEFSLLGDEGFRGLPEEIDADFFSHIKWVKRRSNRLLNWLERYRQGSRGTPRRVLDTVSYFYLAYTMGIKNRIRQSEYDCVIVCCWNNRLYHTISLFLRWLKPKYTIGLANMGMKRSGYSVSMPISGDHCFYFRGDLERMFFQNISPRYPAESTFTDARDNRSAVLIVGAFHPKRRWPIEKYLDVASWLSKEHGLHVSIIGEAKVKSIPDFIANDKNIDLMIGRSSMSAIVSMLSSCSLVVTNDTGFYHLAAMLNRRVVVISNGNSYMTFLHYPQNHPCAANIEEVLAPEFKSALDSGDLDKVRDYTRSSDLDIDTVSVETVKASILSLLRR